MIDELQIERLSVFVSVPPPRAIQTLPTRDTNPGSLPPLFGVDQRPNETFSAIKWTCSHKQSHRHTLTYYFEKHRGVFTVLIGEPASRLVGLTSPPKHGFVSDATPNL